MMAGNVFANSREIACKAGGGKVVASFPDVCMTPPENPATPPGVPVPYPVTSFDSDSTEGTRSVLVRNKEAMQKNLSMFKTCTGDEAGAAAKKGLLSSSHRGKTYFQAWSMDVKLEGQNACRHLDLTTSNHGSVNGNEAVPWLFVKSVDKDSEDPCAKEKKREEEACKDFRPKGSRNVCDAAKLNRFKFFTMKKCASILQSTFLVRKAKRQKQRVEERERERLKALDCLDRRRCNLIPYRGDNGKAEPGSGKCCSKQSAHHVIPKSYLNHKQAYNEDAAPCICVEGRSQYMGTHEMLHARTDKLNLELAKGGAKVSVEQAAKTAALAIQYVFPESQCTQECLEAQIIQGHKKAGVRGNEICRVEQIVGSTKERLEKALQKAREHRNLMLSLR